MCPCSSSYKEFPWHPSNETFDPQLSLTDGDIQNLVEWGFNFVRLGVMWPGVEPARDQVNQTYIAVMQDFVNKLYDAGIYVLIGLFHLSHLSSISLQDDTTLLPSSSTIYTDFHQDLISRFYCGEVFILTFLSLVVPSTMMTMAMMNDDVDLHHQSRAFLTGSL